jgi:hypothetical protein
VHKKSGSPESILYRYITFLSRYRIKLESWTGAKIVWTGSWLLQIFALRPECILYWYVIILYRYKNFILYRNLVQIYNRFVPIQKQVWIDAKTYWTDSKSFWCIFFLLFCLNEPMHTFSMNRFIVLLDQNLPTCHFFWTLLINSSL